MYQFTGDPVEVAKKIEAAIAEMEKLRRQLPGVYNEMAQQAAAYDCAMGLALVKMCLGEGLTLSDGTVIKNPQMAVVKEYAKAACHKEKATMMLAEQKYKSLLKNMEHVAAKLSAYQTLYRHLDVTP